MTGRVSVLLEASHEVQAAAAICRGIFFDPPTTRLAPDGEPDTSIPVDSAIVAMAGLEPPTAFESMSSSSKQPMTWPRGRLSQTSAYVGGLDEWM